jgi:hypothetical protein
LHINWTFGYLRRLVFPTGEAAAQLFSAQSPQLAMAGFGGTAAHQHSTAHQHATAHADTASSAVPTVRLGSDAPSETESHAHGAD